ncbi:MAG: EAL domain-containing protein [Dehalococcoidia bacterium]|nr:EAL domain-containing protein [Dehalococcoidia bacterium]
MDDSTSLFVARQPIFNRNREVYGYELLFRQDRGVALGDVSGSAASAALLADTILTSGLTSLVGRKHAFINFTRDLLLHGFYEVLPPDRVVIELLEDIPADPAVLEACTRLKDSGYRLALDDVTAVTAREIVLAPLADVIKIDLRQISPGARAEVRVHLTEHSSAVLLAEKVETEAEFDACAALGYEYFQGFFLDRPTVVRRPGLRSITPAVTRLLAAVSKPDFEFDEVEEAVRLDLGLCYKTLRFANAAANGRLVPVSNLREALVYLGRAQIMRAASLLLIAGLLDGQPSELAVSSLIRARLLESLAGVGQVPAAANDLYLLGMLSRLDAVFGDRAAALDLITVTDEVRAALNGDPGVYLDLLGLVHAYERGEWGTVGPQAAALGLEVGQVASRYVAAVEFADMALAA